MADIIAYKSLVAILKLTRAHHSPRNSSTNEPINPSATAHHPAGLTFSFQIITEPRTINTGVAAGFSIPNRWKVRTEVMSEDKVSVSFMKYTIHSNTRGYEIQFLPDQSTRASLTV